MATVTARAPFWVPRPSDDFLWQRLPNKSPIMSFLTATKVFGQGGQVPTKRWLPYHVYDDPPHWDGAIPRASATLIPQLTVRQFYAGGQVLQKFWGIVMGQQDDAPMFTASPKVSTIVNYFSSNPPIAPLQTQFAYDDPAFWQGAPASSNLNFLPPLQINTPFSNRQIYWYREDDVWVGQSVDSDAIRMLTIQKIFGKGGQSVTPRYQPQLSQDDSSFWMGHPIASYATTGFLNLYANTSFPPITSVFTCDTPYDDDGWHQAPKSAPLNIIATPETPLLALLTPSALQFGTDDLPAALLQSMATPLIMTLSSQKIFGAGGQVPTPRFQPQLSWDDPPMWQGTPLSSLALVPQLTVKQFYAGGQVLQFRPNWTIDYPDIPWSPPINTLSSFLTLNAGTGKFYGAVGQVVTFCPNFTYDDPSYWVGQATAANIELFIPPGEPVTSRAPSFYEEDTYWTGVPSDSAPIQLLTQQRIFGGGGQVVTYRPNLTQDDASAWWATPVNVPFSISASQEVTYTIQPSPQLLLSRPYDEPNWQKYSTGLGIIQRLNVGQSRPFRWNATYDDSTFWQGTPTGPNIPLNPAPGGIFPFFGPFNNLPKQWMVQDDSAFWVGTPQPSVIQFDLSGSAFSLVAFDTYEHETVWQAPTYTETTLLNFYTAGGQPKQPFFAPKYYIDDWATWNPYQYPPLILQQTTIVYPPHSTVGFISQVDRSVFFTYDVGDAGIWSGKPFSPNYMLTNPGPPKQSVFDWLSYYRRGRRRL